MPGQVLGTEQVGVFAQVSFRAVDDQLVRQSAGFGTLAAIGAAASERLTGQALTAVSHAQRAMHEHLDRQIDALADLRNFAQRKLAGQDHAFDAQTADELDAKGLGERHLRGTMDRQPRRQQTDQPRQPQILHDHGVASRRGDVRRRAGDFRQLVGENQRVERDIASHVAVVQVLDHLGQFFPSEVRRPMPRIEVRQAEIDGIGAVGHGRAQGVPIPCRGEKFGGSLGSKHG